MSNDNCSRDPAARALREAARWRVRLQDPNVSPRSLMRWRKWLASPRNLEAFDSFESLWRDIHTPAHEHRAPAETDAAPILAPERESRACWTAHDDTQNAHASVKNLRSISMEAAYWYVSITDEPAMSASDRRRFLTWLRRSREHAAELTCVITLDAALASQIGSRFIEEGAYNFTDDGLWPAPVRETGSHATMARPQLRERRRDKGNAWVKTLAAGISGVALSLLATALWRAHGEGIIRTGAGEWEEVTLEDGTVTHLDARTRLKIDFNQRRRLIHLYEGTAVFEVAKQPARPFTVRTKQLDAVAAGTRFEVATNSGVSTTTVASGVVNVIRRNTPAPSVPISVPTNHELRVDDGDLSQPAPIEVDATRKLDWVSGWLVFGGETIGDIVSQFNRRNELQIVIDEPQIAARPLDGTYRVRVDSPESLVQILASHEGLTVTEDRSGKEIHLRLQ